MSSFADYNAESSSESFEPEEDSSDDDAYESQCSLGSGEISANECSDDAVEENEDAAENDDEDAAEDDVDPIFTIKHARGRVSIMTRTQGDDAYKKALGELDGKFKDDPSLVAAERTRLKRAYEEFVDCVRKLLLPMTPNGEYVDPFFFSDDPTSLAGLLTKEQASKN